MINYLLNLFSYLPTLYMLWNMYRIDLIENYFVVDEFIWARSIFCLKKIL